MSPVEAPPLGSALFSADQMEQHGKALAACHTPTRAGAGDRLLPRLAAHETLLAGACNLLTQAVEANRRITPAAE
jgi:cyclic beta-1,2-glucan synthetase